MIEPLITATGVFNFRDLAPLGSTVRTGLVFRADGIHRTDDDGRAAIIGLGVQRVVDLRTVEEREREGFFAADGVANRSVPIVRGQSEMAAQLDETADDSLHHHYGRMLADNGAALAAVLELIAAAIVDDVPIVFHCTAGKDRTGIVAALTLAVVGVADDVIASDYGRSAAAAQAMAAWYRKKRGGEDMTSMFGMSPAMADRMLQADPETMRRVLVDLRSAHGGADPYLRRHGLGDAELATLRSLGHSVTTR